MKTLVRSIVSLGAAAGLALPSSGTAQARPGSLAAADDPLALARQAGTGTATSPVEAARAMTGAPDPARGGWPASWTRSDVALEAAYAALALADWGQTNTIAATPGFYEKNPLLGRKPSRTATGLYFPAMVVGHAAVSYLLPSTWRRVWQCVTIGYEGAAVLGNFQAGIQLRY
jgi:hypothetical protein